MLFFFINQTGSQAWIL